MRHKPDVPTRVRILFLTGLIGWMMFIILILSVSSCGYPKRVLDGEPAAIATAAAAVGGAVISTLDRPPKSERLPTTWKVQYHLLTGGRAEDTPLDADLDEALARVRLMDPVHLRVLRDSVTYVYADTASITAARLQFLRDSAAYQRLVAYRAGPQPPGTLVVFVVMDDPDDDVAGFCPERITTDTLPRHLFVTPRGLCSPTVMHAALLDATARAHRRARGGSRRADVYTCGTPLPQ